MSFSVPLRVRGYELDTLGHVNHAVYVQYAEHARWELLREAGITPAKLVTAGIGPVVLEQTIKYKRELRDGDEVTIDATFEWKGGKLFRINQEIRRADGVVSATVSVLGGVMDLTARKLVDDPRERFFALTDRPELLGYVPEPNPVG